MNKIKRNEDEPEERYKVRKMFISLMESNNKKNSDIILMYSNIFVNIVYLRCKYSKEIEKYIDDFIKKNKKPLADLIKDFNKLK